MTIDGELAARAARVKLVALDVDGVLTDGGIVLTADGGEIKTFHVRDGLGMALARRQGLVIALVSGRPSKVTELRGGELSVDAIRMGPRDKGEVVRELAAEFGCELSEIAFVGDDVIDLPALSIVGFPAAVADAHPKVRARVPYVTTLPGGRGAVREVLDLILDAKGKNPY